jgi:glycosyltransferase involved in cell wall biosynthesis
MKNKAVLLFIGFVWPELKATAASQNIISYMRTFANALHEVHFASASAKTPLSSDLTQWDIHCHHIELNHDSFDEWISQLQPDIVIFDRFLSEEQFGWRVAKSAPKALRVLDCEDLHFLRHARQQIYNRHGYHPKIAPYLTSDYVLAPQHTGILYSDLAVREIASILRSDLTITLSAFEARILHERFNVCEHQIACVPYICEAYPIITPITREHFVSIGNFRHAPNIDAVNILIQHLWPKIHKRLPQTKCYIYGAYMPPKIKALHNPSIGIHVEGHVDDHMHTLSNARVLLAPIQFGAGVKGKILDALRCALPSITTPIGAEGIVYEQWPGAVTTNEQEFVEQAVLNYTSQQDMKSLCASILADNFDYTRNSNILLDSVLSAYHVLSESREHNFMQKMMMHNTLQSHKYMSQWIAAKNAHIKPNDSVKELPEKTIDK